MTTAAVDVLVIGAGIHGAGVAQAAAAAGYSVLVLEKTGVACATSCRSSKLIHGGLRYLETGQYRLVRESLRERETLLRIAPHLVKRVPFHIPVYKFSTRSTLKIRAGLALYALLDNLKRASHFSTLARAEWDTLDGLDTTGLKAVFRYHDAQADDAKLTHAVLHSAQTLGAELLCPAEFVTAARTASGWRVRVRGAHGEQEVDAATLVNTAGPWVNEIIARLTPRLAPPAIELVQGAHVLVEGASHCGVYYLEAEDRRALFVMPWRGMTLIGTTESHFSGDPAQVAPRREEIDYLLKTFRRYFPRRDVCVRDQFAGLRVLPMGTGSAFNRPRETLFVTDNAAQPRLVSVVGGKLTGYRVAAQRTLALLRATLPLRPARSDTATLDLTS
jgi:glycerol-3-phosphate dehydrogenase